MAYNPIIIDYVCDQLALGRGLLSISKDNPADVPGLEDLDKLPNESVMRYWALNDNELAARYARARLIGNESDFERLHEWANEMPPRLENGAIDNGWNTWNRNRIEAKKWELSKRQPGRFGDRVGVEHSGAVTLSQILSGMDGADTGLPGRDESE